MSNPLVSVIIPAYNHEQYVQETIRSIINQTYQNIELIIIDDGSKDQTFNKITELKEQCKKRFKSIHFETKENEGTCRTLNKLLSLSQGKYIYLIASDDLAKPNAIETEVSFLEENPDYILVVGDDEIIDSASQRIGWDKHQKQIDLNKATYITFAQFLQDKNKPLKFNSGQFGRYETLVNGNYIPNGFLIRADIIKKIGFTKEAPLEDWNMHLQLSKIGKMKFIDQILFSYRWHDTNTIKRKEYMQKIALQTLLYEKKLVHQLPDKRWEKIFTEKTNQIKINFNLFGLLKYYKVKTLEEKKYILEVCGYKIPFHKKIMS